MPASFRASASALTPLLVPDRWSRTIFQIMRSRRVCQRECCDSDGRSKCAIPFFKPRVILGGMMNAIKCARFLVTGGAGFVGSTIVDHLLDSGAAEVRVVDNSVRGSWSTLTSA